MTHSLQKKFSKLLQFFPENLQHTERSMNKMKLTAVIFIRKRWSKSFNNGIVYNRVGFKCTCATVSRHYTELFYKIFTKAIESGRLTGGCNFRNILPINIQNVTEGKFMFLYKKFSNLPGFYYLEPGLYPSITDIVEAMNTLIQDRNNHCENCITVKMSRRTQKLIFTLQMKDLVMHSLVRIWDTFSEVVLVMNLD